MEENKSKRSSFFFFSGGSKNGVSSGKSQSKVTAKNPLSKPPLKNTSISPSNVAREQTNGFTNASCIDSEIRADESKGGSTVDKKLTINTHEKFMDDSILANSQVNKPSRPSNTILRRPPPPMVDLNALTTELSTNRSLETLSHSVDIKADTLTPSSPAETPVEPTITGMGHKREKSEIDQLMDDLEKFESERRANIEANLSIHSLRSKEDSQGPNDGIVDLDPELDSPIAYVSSLNLGESKQSLISEEAESYKDSIYRHLPKREDSYGGSSEHDNEIDGNDGDEFSFTDSHGESVQDLQQVSFNNTSGSVPVVSSFGYTTDGQSRAPTTPSYQSSESDFDHDDMPLTASPYEDRLGDEQPRQYRVVNNDKASFYFNEESSTTEDDNHSLSTVNNTALSQSTSSQLSTSNDDSPTRALLEDINMSKYSPQLNQTTSMTEGSNRIENDLIQRSEHLSNSTNTSSTKSSTASSTHPDKSIRLVSSYVEELRLKYFPTSNSLKPPPNLPHVLKNKNNLEKPQNIKVRIRTSSKQIGIKHGKAKQKLLSLETTNEEKENDTSILSNSLSAPTQVDHTKEFHDLFGKNSSQVSETLPRDDEDLFLNDIPGDEAYDSDDLMAPLREHKDEAVKFAGEDMTIDGPTNNRVGRSDTVTSYFTRKANRLRSGTLDVNYNYLPKLPTETARMGSSSDLHYDGSFANDNQNTSEKDTIFDDDDMFYASTYTGALHITNQSSESD